MGWVFALLAAFFLASPEYVCREPGVDGKRRSLVALEVGFDQGEGWHLQTRFGAKFAAELGPHGLNSCEGDDFRRREPDNICDTTPSDPRCVPRMR